MTGLASRRKSTRNIFGVAGHHVWEGCRTCSLVRARAHAPNRVPRLPCSRCPYSPLPYHYHECIESFRAIPLNIRPKQKLSYTLIPDLHQRKISTLLHQVSPQSYAFPFPFSACHRSPSSLSFSSSALANCTCGIRNQAATKASALSTAPTMKTILNPS